MDGIRKERLNAGPILNFNERLYRQPLSKKFFAYVKKSVNSVSPLEVKLLAENLCRGKRVGEGRSKIWCFPNLALARSHYPKTWKHIHETRLNRSKLPLNGDGYGKLSRNFVSFIRNNYA